jgi:hypothetical protein
MVLGSEGSFMCHTYCTTGLRYIGLAPKLHSYILKDLEKDFIVRGKTKTAILVIVVIFELLFSIIVTLELHGFVLWAIYFHK